MQRVTTIAFFLGLLVSALASVAQQPPPAPTMPPGPPPTGKQLPMPNFPEPIGQPRVDMYELASRVIHFPKSMAMKVGERRVRAFGVMNEEFELVGEDGDDYLVRMLPPEDPKSPLHKAWLRQSYDEVLSIQKDEYFKDKYMIAGLPDFTPPFTKKLAFERRDEGLPKSGHWQMSFDIADMNGDGLPDLILPPARLGVTHPSIYLQQPDGTWALWEQTFWPKFKMDYGSVRVADFDGDGNLDIALTSHFGETYILYGNGKGDFTRTQKLPKPNQSVSARALTVADFNNDGRPDVATMAEIDLDMATNKTQRTGLVVVYLNLPEGWKAVTQGFPTEIQGDWLTAADIDGDGWVDLLLTSRKEGITDLIMRNVGKGTAFQPIASNFMPSVGFAFANAAAPLDRFKQPDLVLCFEQFNPFEGQDPSQACTIYRFHDAKGKPTLTPKPELLVKRRVAFDNFKAVAVGDIDGDGRNDIAVITSNGELRIFLQFPDGKFYEDLSQKIKLDHTDPFDIRIADLHHSGKGDIVIMGSPSGAERGGGVWVFSPHPQGAKPEQAKVSP